MDAFKFTLAADGTSLAYQSHGSGHPLIFTNGYATSTFYWRPLMGRLGHRARLVTWDLKGHGRSAPARDMGSVTVPACADDLRRVMDAAGIERATLLGFSFGCQIVLEAWRHFPDRINAIVPILGPYGRPFDNVFDPRVGKVVFRAFQMAGPRGASMMLRTGWYGAKLPGSHEVARKLGMVCNSVGAGDMRPFYDHLGAIDAETWFAMGAAAQEHSAEDLLSTIDVPVLVITGGRDSFAPAHLGQRMSELIEGSRWLHIADATHTGLLGHTDVIGDEVERFLDSLDAKPARQAVT
ncbi:MAG: alpha/beta hydrolase [Bradymonadaceae bacterium]|nr:alpha/beta hydrolase [Lujinxingiaceae bacterium]